MSTGKELWEVSDEIATEVANFDFTSYAEAHFNSMKSVLAKVEPDYKSWDPIDVWQHWTNYFENQFAEENGNKYWWYG